VVGAFEVGAGVWARRGHGGDAGGPPE
jgi:hypothetical protein